MKLCVRCGQNDAKVWLEGVGRVHPKCMSEAETARHLKEQQQASNQRYGEEQQALAIIKRTRKRAKAIVNARQQAIRNAYDNSLATGFVNEFGEVPFEVYDAALSKFPHPQPITINHSYQDQPTA